MDAQAMRGSIQRIPQSGAWTVAWTVQQESFNVVLHVTAAVLATIFGWHPRSHIPNTTYRCTCHMHTEKHASWKAICV
jgi:hypothetical protein